MIYQIYNMRTVYILRCSDNSLYTWITKDIDRRIIEHNTSKLGANYTKSRRPVTLEYSEMASNRSEASIREREIKQFDKRKKELLVSSKSN